MYVHVWILVGVEPADNLTGGLGYHGPMATMATRYIRHYPKHLPYNALFPVPWPSPWPLKFRSEIFRRLFDWNGCLLGYDEVREKATGRVNSTLRWINRCTENWCSLRMWSLKEHISGVSINRVTRKWSISRWDFPSKKPSIVIHCWGPPIDGHPHFNVLVLKLFCSFGGYQWYQWFPAADAGQKHAALLSSQSYVASSPKRGFWWLISMGEGNWK